MTNDKINEIDYAIISAIKENKYITIPELSNLIDKSEPTIYRHLNILASRQKIKRIGSRKAGYWEITE